ncbi:MAG: hypothetical protein DMG97_10805 [Acidobacteria bacterium]|nr:MAG: hypothetical protein DMG97_10805 [Acidobacteriota bacterium]
MQANTYCMARLKHMGNRLCCAPIPLGEKLCADCKVTTAVMTFPQAKPVERSLCAQGEPDAQ